MSPGRAHHISFPVTDLARSRAFYESVLGLQTIPRPSFPVDGIWYQAGEVQVHLIVTPDGMDVGSPAPALNPVARHAAFTIDDYATTLDRLQAQGMEVFETSPEAGQMWVRDPDGHIIELIVEAAMAARIAQEHSGG